MSGGPAKVKWSCTTSLGTGYEASAAASAKASVAGAPRNEAVACSSSGTILQSPGARTIQERGAGFHAIADGPGRPLLRNRNPAANRLGVGGAARPCFVRDGIVTGFRLCAKARDEGPIERIPAQKQAPCEALWLATPAATPGWMAGRNQIIGLALARRDLLSPVLLTSGVSPIPGAACGHGGGVNRVSLVGRTATNAFLAAEVAAGSPAPDTGAVRVLRAFDAEAVQEFRHDQTSLRAEFGFAGVAVGGRIYK